MKKENFENRQELNDEELKLITGGNDKSQPTKRHLNVLKQSSDVQVVETQKNQNEPTDIVKNLDVNTLND